MIVLLLAASISTELGSFMRSYDGWSLRRANDGVCSISEELPNGTTAAVIAGATGNPKLMLFNSAWQSLAVKQRVPIKIDVNGGIAEGTAAAGMFGAYPFVRATMPWDTVDIAIGNIGSIMKVTTGDAVLALVPGNSPMAALALRACATGATDPFAK